MIISLCCVYLLFRLLLLQKQDSFVDIKLVSVRPHLHLFTLLHLAIVIEDLLLLLLHTTSFSMQTKKKLILKYCDNYSSRKKTMDNLF
jgi:hypothetical protein